MIAVSICCLKVTKEALVNDCWAVRIGTLTPGSNNCGSDTFKLSEKVDGFVCRPCIKEDGMPYGIVLWLIAPGCQNPCVDAFPIAGMACEIGAVVVTPLCERGDTCAGFVNPTSVITSPVLLDGIECVPPCEIGGFIDVSDVLAAFDAIAV